MIQWTQEYIEKNRMDEHKPGEERIQVLSDLLARVLALQEIERRTAIHTLQEGVGQTLAALNLNLRVLERYNDQPEVLEMIRNMRALASNAMHEIDLLQQSLYPLALESQGIIAAVETYIQAFARDAQVQVSIDMEASPYRLPAEIEIAIFRIVQDILEHLREQPGVSRIQVRLRFVKNYVYLVLENDGTSVVKSWHTDLMTERVLAHNGQCAMIQLPATGTRFEIAIPLQNELKR